MLLHVCNPSNLRGRQNKTKQNKKQKRHWKDHGLSIAQVRPHLNKQSWVWWYMPMIPNTQNIGKKIVARGQPRQKCETLSKKIKKGLGMWFKR
jgi:hypothetical protein